MIQQLNGASFCFTGKFSDLKRAIAEQEVRARGGLTSKSVNHQLDYLVIGAIPSPSWAHGNYGRKIERAQELIASGNSKLTLISEDDFLTSLASFPATNSGEIDAQVVVFDHKFFAPKDAWYDSDGLTGFLTKLHVDDQCHVKVNNYSALSFVDLFGSFQGAFDAGGRVILVRVVRQMPLDEPIQPFIAQLESELPQFHGPAYRSHWFQRTEGSGDYIRLLREIPVQLRAPDL